MKNASAFPPVHLSHRAPLYFLVLSILCQLVGMGVLSMLQDLLVSPQVLLALHSILAFLLSRWLGLTLPWQLFNLLLAPSVVAYLYFELPSGWAFGALVVTLLLYAPTFWTRVPYFPTHPRLYDTVAGLIPTQKSVKVLDLGCGMGRLLNYLGKVRPDASFTGVEISPLAFALAKLWLRLNGRENVSVRLKNFWNMSLADYDIVYAFLAPGPMPALWEKAREEMKPGSVFITNTFQVEGSETRKIETGERHQHTIYVHSM